MSDWWRRTKDDPKARESLAPSLLGMLDTGEEEGWKDDDLLACAVPELWALEANAPYGEKRWPLDARPTRTELTRGDHQLRSGRY